MSVCQGRQKGVFMEKYKVCPSCGKHNLPSLLECLDCETDLTSVRNTDKETEKRQSKLLRQDKQNGIEYVRMCDCGCTNTIGSRKCNECGEDISDVVPSSLETWECCKYVLATADGSYTFEWKDSSIVIGRENAMQEYLCKKPYVSRRHAKLLVEDGMMYIENLSGTNYTFVNNKKIEEKKLVNIGDEIALGGNESNGVRQGEAAYFVLRRV